MTNTLPSKSGSTPRPKRTGRESAVRPGDDNGPHRGIRAGSLEPLEQPLADRQAKRIHRRMIDLKHDDVRFGAVIHNGHMILQQVQFCACAGIKGAGPGVSAGEPRLIR